MTISIFNSDCFDILPLIKENSIDLVIVDLPYSQTSLSWDIAIDLDKMWIELKRCCTKKCVYVFFCTTKFGYTIIKSNPKWFKYDLVWEKSKKVGFLSANRMPLRKHEMIYVFGDKDEDKTGMNDNLQEYANKLFKSIGKTKKGIKKDIGDISHFFTGKNVKQFRIPIEDKYNLMIQKYKIDKLDYFIPYKKLIINKPENTYNPQKTLGHKPYKQKQGNQTDTYGIDKKEKVTTINKGDRHPTSILKYEEPTHEMVYVMGDPKGTHKTYNPQKTEGHTPYKTKNKSVGYYREKKAGATGFITDNKGTRHPTSILKYEEPTVLQFNNPSKPVHRTQKPVDLIEWLIKSYSNEGDTVLDFTAGSGSTGIACINTKRKFIGIEMDKDIFKIMKDRIDNHLKN